MNHYQEIRKYGPLNLLQFIQDDNQTFHPLKAIQNESHYQEIREYGPFTYYSLFKMTIKHFIH